MSGVDLTERDRMIDCLLDWVDPDNLVRLNGAEDEPGYKPSNAPLKTVDELKRIKGWEEFSSRPDWDADFTLNSPDAKIDINSASRDVLLSLPGITEPLADRLLELRRGPDGIEGTGYRCHSESAALAPAIRYRASKRTSFRRSSRRQNGVRSRRTWRAT